GPAPGPAIALDERLGLGRSPRPRGVRRELGDALAPRGEDRVDERPLLLDLVATREERRVAAQRVEDERLVRIRRVEHERRAVDEVHVDRPDTQPLHRDLRPEGEADALIRLDAQHELVRLEALFGFALEDAVRRHPEADRDLGRALRQTLPGTQVERYAFPAPV